MISACVVAVAAAAVAATDAGAVAIIVIITARLFASFLFHFECLYNEPKLSTWIIRNLENLFLIRSQKLTFHGSMAETMEKFVQKKNDELNRWKYKRASYEYFTVLPNCASFCKCVCVFACGKNCAPSRILLCCVVYFVNVVVCCDCDCEYVLLYTHVLHA